MNNVHTNDNCHFIIIGGRKYKPQIQSLPQVPKKETRPGKGNNLHD